LLYKKQELISDKEIKEAGLQTLPLCYLTGMTAGIPESYFYAGG
jgi:hypothetical protein